MSAHSYNDLRAHIGHKIACVCYGADGEDPENIALECEDCSEVLVSFNKGDSTVDPLSGKAWRRSITEGTPTGTSILSGILIGG
ncbi:MAG: hypothetical protein D4S01_05105 [Dehalococcoidia bacterium]|nr:MAG: hypothetical protein D4S01_05105 [Dehalococcoidia bacterium]